MRFRRPVLYVPVAQRREQRPWGDSVRNTLGKQGSSNFGSVPKRSTTKPRVIGPNPIWDAIFKF